MCDQSEYDGNKKNRFGCLQSLHRHGFGESHLGLCQSAGARNYNRAKRNFPVLFTFKHWRMTEAFSDRLQTLPKQARSISCHMSISSDRQNILKENIFFLLKNSIGVIVEVEVDYWSHLFDSRVIWRFKLRFVLKVYFCLLFR